MLRNKELRTGLVLLIILLVLGIILQKTIINKVTPDEEDILGRVSNIMLLPQDETPTIVEVVDTSEIRDQSFFRNAQVGDQVIMYLAAQKAILYRPSDHRIIEVGVPSVPTPTPQPTPSLDGLEVTLYNGTSVPGLSRQYEKEFKAKFPNQVVLDKVAAAYSDYEDTVVIDLTGQKPQEVEAIAGELGIKIGELRDGETKPSAGDFLIIVGGDKAQNSE